LLDIGIPVGGLRGSQRFKMEDDAMMDPKMTMKVPPQVREFAEKSVEAQLGT